MRWTSDQRLAFIETLLYWEGEINRKDLEDFFDISKPVASAEFKRYQETVPDGMTYDRSDKVYKAGADFTPRFISVDPNDYFSLLRLSQNDRFRQRSFLRFCPDFQVLAFPERKVDPVILKRVVRAMRTGEALEIRYQSMSTPEPHWRWINPHAFGFDGFRWHIRAYCHMRKGFRDFVPGRILATGAEQQMPGAGAEDDLLWQREVIFKIAPHPKLSEGQRKMIEHEYGMTNGEKHFAVNAAFSFYIIHRLRLDDGGNERIVLLNREAIEEEVARIEMEQQTG